MQVQMNNTTTTFKTQVDLSIFYEKFKKKVGLSYKLLSWRLGRQVVVVDYQGLNDS